MGRYNRLDKCGKIKKVGFSWRKCGRDFHGRILREYDENGNWTGNWICYQCYKEINKYGTTDVETIKKIKYPYYGSICPRCKEEKERDGIELTDDSILYPGKALHETDKNGNKTNVWVCHKHGVRSYERYDLDSRSNIIKSLADRRTRNLSYDRHILGDKCQECTCKWLGSEDLNKKNDNYDSLYDHSPIHNGVYIKIGDKIIDLSGKIPQTKGRSYDPIEGRWHQELIREQNKEFDILIFYCISENANMIEKIYIFPKEHILKKKSISITKNPSRGYWYEEYKVTGENELIKVNKIWQFSYI